MSFEELEREVRQELWHERWRKMRPGVIVLVVMILLSVTGYKGWQYYQSEQEIAAAERYFQIQQLLEQDDPSSIDALQAIIADQGNLGYQWLAQFRLASQYIAEENPAQARQTLLELAQQQDLRPYLRTVALLQAALLPAPQEARTGILVQLTPLLSDTNPWRHIARMAEVELLLRENNTAAVREKIEVMLNDSSTPVSLRETMSNILAVL